jgi:arsenite methyltransferase
MRKYYKNDFSLSEYVSFSDECSLWSAPFGLKLLEYIDYKPGILALDIGFGTGFPLTELALRLGENSIVYGIDPWTDAIERVKKKIEFYRIRNIKIFQGYAESIPLEHDSIDLITSNNGINNVKDISQVISECSRIMKTGGQFIQTMNLDKSMFEFYDELEKTLGDLKMNDEIALMHQHIREKRPPLDEIVMLLGTNDFMVRDIIQDQFSYRFSDGTTMLNHYFIRLAFMDSWMKILPNDKQDQVFKTVEQRLNEKARIFGGLKLSIPFVLINAKKR